MTPRAVAVKAAREAGKIIVAGFNKPHRIASKSQREIVTEIDYMSERKIISLIRRHFPDHSILSEEAGRIKMKPEYLWIIDPLDGTTNYSIKNPFFAVSIALAKMEGNKYKPALGVVYAPATDEMFVAERGRGAYLNGKRIHVTGETDLRNLLLVYCHGKDKKTKQRVVKLFAKIKPISLDFNRMRSSSLELAFVACGRLGSYISTDVKVWDMAAGGLLVEEAGGRVTDFRGKDWDPGKVSFSLLASNMKIHSKLLRLVRN